MSNHVQYTEEADYCIITMDDGKANALSFEMLEQLNSAFDRAEEAGKVVIFTGREGRFSAGFDLNIMVQGGEIMFKLLSAGGDLARRVFNFKTPVIIASNGHTMAMGAILLLCADYRIGTNGSYKVGLNETAIGMIMPHFGVALGQYRLAKPYLQQAIALATVYTPEQAVTASYLDEAVEAEQLLERAKTLATSYASLNMDAYRTTKARLQEQVNAKLDGAIARELKDAGMG